MTSKTLTKAERIAIALCVLFVIITLGVRLWPVSEDGFSLETRASEVSAEPEPGHYVNGLLDLNSATEKELTALPGIGEVLAGRIVELREEKNGFASVDELTEVYGLGDAILEGIIPYVTLEEQNEDSGS